MSKSSSSSLPGDGREEKSSSGKSKTIGFKGLKRERHKIMSEHFGYTDESNPFGDSNLAEPFIWKKKNAYLKAAGKLSLPTASSLVDQAHRKVTEIESVKKRREEREDEERLLEEQRAVLDREREQEHYDEWKSKEEEFHRNQALKKTEIRLEQGRERPIDLLVKATRMLSGQSYEYLTLLDQPPRQLIQGMSEAELKELLQDVNLHKGAEDADGFAEFWRSLEIIVKEAQSKMGRKEPQAMEGSRDAESGIPLSVLRDVEALLGKKSAAQLEILEGQVNDKLRRFHTEEDDTIDPSYWEAIQKKLPYHKAVAEVQRVHDLSLSMSRELKQQKKSQRVNTDDLLGDEPDAEQERKRRKLSDETHENPNADGSLSPELEPYDADVLPVPLPGSCSPQLLSFEEFSCLSAPLMDPVDERDRRRERKAELVRKRRERNVVLARQQQKGSTPPAPVVQGGERGEGGSLWLSPEGGKLVSSPSGWGDDDPNMAAVKATAFEDFVKKERKSMAADEEVMTSSSEVVSHIQRHYDWEDKYRPRKPRFFNRVKTGYEWNKYNQTHYDHDNPPPKTVQGYKFNIFYPDLIDKTKAPTWTIKTCPPEEGAIKTEFDQTVILTFHAGPPYEDVAFKIINREWSLERMQGFKNVFDKGILQLYFVFKRFRYRR